MNDDDRFGVINGLECYDRRTWFRERCDSYGRYFINVGEDGCDGYFMFELLFMLFFMFELLFKLLKLLLLLNNSLLLILLLYILNTY